MELCADGGVFRKMSEIKVKPIEWVIPGVVPRGELTLLGGDGGVGKGLYLAQMIAYVTTGETSGFFPDHLTSTGTVIIFSGEDQMDAVWKPRLEAAGADSEKVRTCSTVRRARPTCGGGDRGDLETAPERRCGRLSRESGVKHLEN